MTIHESTTDKSKTIELDGDDANEFGLSLERLSDPENSFRFLSNGFSYFGFHNLLDAEESSWDFHAYGHHFPSGSTISIYVEGYNNHKAKPNVNRVEIEFLSERTEDIRSAINSLMDLTGFRKLYEEGIK